MSGGNETAKNNNPLSIGSTPDTSEMQIMSTTNAAIIKVRMAKKHDPLSLSRGSLRRESLVQHTNPQN
jgi:hypothetical protein